MVSGVRAFLREDIPEVADLWLRIFRRLEGPASDALRAYFRETFFESPWRDESLPSLVYEEEGGGIVGFLGVLPRVMTFDGKPIKVAVATQLMVDERARSVYTAVRLMKKFFSGTQDLSFSDGANEASERLWLAAGGHIALLYSLDWTRVLRPAQHALALVKRRKPVLMPLAGLLRPVCRLLDAVVVRSRLGRWLRRYWLPEVTDAVVDEKPAEDALLWCVRNLSGKRALQPEYESDSFRWLLRKAGEKRFHGELRKGVVRNRNGEILGWYLYYLRPGGVGQVLQFGGRPKSIRKVLDHLFHQAWKQGAVAISGELEPRFSRDLADSRCRFTWPGYWPGCGVLVQSKRSDILNAIHRGDAFLSRLEGEWWARFSDPEWSRPAAPRSAYAAGGSGVPDTQRAHAG